MMKDSDLSNLGGGIRPELPGVLEALIAALKTVLGESLVGVYATGSLAIGDFDRDSDIDLLVVTDEELSQETVDALQARHREIHAMGVYAAQHLEVSYISRRVLGDVDGVGRTPLWYLDNGSTTFERSTHDNTWVVRWTLRERGVRLLGPPPSALLEPVPRDALVAETSATMQVIADEFEKSLGGPLNFWTSRFGQAFTVLTCCRMLQLLHSGAVSSKLAAVRWARQALDSQWSGFIDAAWRNRQGANIGQPADAQMLARTPEFVQYALGERDRLMHKR